MNGNKPLWYWSNGSPVSAAGAVSLSRGGPSVITDSGGETAAIIWRICYSCTFAATSLLTLTLSRLGNEASSFRRGLIRRARRFFGTTEHVSSTTTQEGRRP